MLTDKEAAEYLGMTVEELWLTKYKGMPPGNLAVKDDGVFYWEKNKALSMYGRKPAEEYIEYICNMCGFKAKSSQGLQTHQRMRKDDEEHTPHFPEIAEDAFYGLLTVDEVRDSEKEE